MHEVFISYSRRQSRQVSEVVAELERRGVPVWLDRSDIPQGVPWEQQLRRAIRECDLAAYFMSDDWLVSDACASERDVVAEYDKPVVLVRADASEFTPQGAAADIEAAYLARDETETERTSLEAAAAAWADSGRARKQLARGANLKSFRSTLRGVDNLTDLAVGYVAASRRAARIKAFDLVAGLLLIAAGATVISAFPAAYVQAEVARTELSIRQSVFVMINNALDRGPYDALDIALRFGADGSFDANQLYITALLDATSADIPVDRGAASQARFADFRFAPHEVAVTAPDGSRSAQVTDTDGRVLLRSGDRPADVVADITVPGRASAAAFSPDGGTLAVLSDQGVTLVDATRGRLWRTLTGADLSRRGQLAWSSDGRQLAVRQSDDAVVTVWNVLSETKLLGRTGLWLMDSATLGSTGRVAFLARDGSLAIADSRTDSVDVHPSPVSGITASAIAADSSGSRAYVIGRTDGVGTAYAIDLRDMTAKALHVPSDCTPAAVAMNPADDSTVYVGCGSRIVKLRPDGAVTGEQTTEMEVLSALGVARDGSVAVAAAGGGGFGITGADGKELRPEGASVTGTTAIVGTCPGSAALDLRFTPDGARIYATGDGTGFGMCARVLSFDGSKWTMSTPPVASDQANQSRGMAISPNGAYVAIGLSDGSVQLLQSDRSDLGWRWREQSGEIRGVEFTPDSSSVVIGTRDGVITMAPVLQDRFDGTKLRELARQRLDRARELGLTDLTGTRPSTSPSTLPSSPTSVSPPASTNPLASAGGSEE